VDVRSRGTDSSDGVRRKENQELSILLSWTDKPYEVTLSNRVAERNDDKIGTRKKASYYSIPMMNNL